MLSSYMCVWFFDSLLQDKSQIEFLTENKRKLQHQLEEECDHLRKDKIRLTGELCVILALIRIYYLLLQEK